MLPIKIPNKSVGLACSFSRTHWFVSSFRSLYILSVILWCIFILRMIEIWAINARCKLLTRHGTHQSAVELSGNAITSLGSSVETPWLASEYSGKFILWNYHMKLHIGIFFFFKCFYDRWLLPEILQRSNYSVATQPDAIGS